ncbi:MAG: flagellar hook-basal body protein [Actinobacteria bacterium]|nr:flagellar hook-basal body protein [Actinomycetota bacterium]
MERGLYIAASGMVAEQMRQDQIANDLANSSTPGYKADRVMQRAFADLLLSNTATGQAIGGLTTGVAADRMVTDTSPQPVRDTGEPLDLAIVGDGWFAVQTPQGVRYTRNGQFSAAADGTLTDQLGNRVLSPAGQPVKLDANGHVNARDVGVFALTGPAKQGDNLFTGTAAGPAAGTVRTGALEGSGVDPARTMVDMIASFRAFEAGQKVIQTIDESLHKTAAQVGSPNGGA